MATLGHLIKLCRVWGDITRWAFDDVDDSTRGIWEEHRVTSASQLLTQWDLELPIYSKWCYENYASHSVPGVALGGCFVFMHILNRTSFVLLGHRILDKFAQSEDGQPVLLEQAIASHSTGLAATFRKVYLSSLSRLTKSRTRGLLLILVFQAVESTSFILDVSNDPVNVLGTTFVDYALYLASLLHIRISHSHRHFSEQAPNQERTAAAFVRGVLLVYQRRLPYWAMTRSYCRKLMQVYQAYLTTSDYQPLHRSTQISLDYGSIVDQQTAADGHEDHLIKELIQSLSSDTTPLLHLETSNVEILPAESEQHDNTKYDTVFDIDNLLATQRAAEAISTCLSLPNDEWWTGTFGQDPYFETFG